MLVVHPDLGYILEFVAHLEGVDIHIGVQGQGIFLACGHNFNGVLPVGQVIIGKDDFLPPRAGRIQVKGAHGLPVEEDFGDAPVALPAGQQGDADAGKGEFGPVAGGIGIAEGAVVGVPHGVVAPAAAGILHPGVLVVHKLGGEGRAAARSLAEENTAQGGVFAPDLVDAEPGGIVVFVDEVDAALKIPDGLQGGYQIEGVPVEHLHHLLPVFPLPVGKVEGHGVLPFFPQVDVHRKGLVAGHVVVALVGAQRPGAGVKAVGGKGPGVIRIGDKGNSLALGQPDVADIVRQHPDVVSAVPGQQVALRAVHPAPASLGRCIPAHKFGRVDVFTLLVSRRLSLVGYLEIVGAGGKAGEVDKVLVLAGGRGGAAVQGDARDALFHLGQGHGGRGAGGHRHRMGARLHIKGGLDGAVGGGRPAGHPGQLPAQVGLDRKAGKARLVGFNPQNLLAHPGQHPGAPGMGQAGIARLVVGNRGVFLQNVVPAGAEGLKEGGAAVLHLAAPQIQDGRDGVVVFPRPAHGLQEHVLVKGGVGNPV